MQTANERNDIKSKREGVNKHLNISFLINFIFNNNTFSRVAVIKVKWSRCQWSGGKLEESVEGNAVEISSKEIHLNSQLQCIPGNATGSTFFVFSLMPLSFFGHIR